MFDTQFYKMKFPSNETKTHFEIFKLTVIGIVSIACYVLIKF